MLNTYVFLFETKPSPQNTQNLDIAEASATIFVIDEQIDSAEQRARDYLDAYAWIVLKIEKSVKLAPEQISRLQRPLLDLYQKAQDRGIAALFDGRKHQDFDGPPEIRLL